MSRKSSIFLLVSLVVFASGCAGVGSYGRLTAARGGDVSIESLVSNWAAYEVYYAGYYSFKPSAILFDPRGDDRDLVHDKWIRIRDQRHLKELLSWMQDHSQTYPQLFRILGPDGRFYGYFFSAWNHVLLKGVDEKSVYVYDLPYPPEPDDRKFPNDSQE